MAMILDFVIPKEREKVDVFECKWSPNEFPLTRWRHSARPTQRISKSSSLVEHGIQPRSPEWKGCQAVSMSAFWT